jgi:transaldolase
MIRPVLEALKTKVFADGANLEGILELRSDRRISGFTTNPTLMRAAGITDYELFAKTLLSEVTDMPISFEVFADDEDEIRRQALLIASWADNVYVKIPVTTTSGQSLAPLVGDLSASGVKVNVTAMFTLEQVEVVTKAVTGGASSYLSIFAGRIADAGQDPVNLMREAIEIMSAAQSAECIWASPREILNLIQADSVGCHIITMTHDLIKKLDGLGKDLTQFSLETVQMFHRDATLAGFKL